MSNKNYIKSNWFNEDSVKIIEFSHDIVISSDYLFVTPCESSALVLFVPSQSSTTQRLV